MKGFFILFLLLHLATFTKAQSSADSLKLVLSHTTIDQYHLEKYLNLLQKLPTGEIENAAIIGNWIINNTGSKSLLQLRASAYLALGKAYTIIANYERGAFYLTSAQSIAEKINFILPKQRRLMH